jgi:competence protein ComEC
MPLVPVAASMVFGGAVGGLLPCGVATAIAWWSSAVAALVTWWLASRSARAPWASVWLLLAVTLASAGWCGARRHLFPREDVAWRLDAAPRPIVLEGVALESPRSIPREHRGGAAEPASEFTLRVGAVRLGGAWKPAAGRASIVVDGSVPAVLPGAVLRVFGRGVRPSPALNPDEFDFRAKARDLGCLSIVRCRTGDGIEVVSQPAWYAPALGLHHLRVRGMERLEEAIAPSRRAFAQALLLGSRESLPREESREFLVTGSVHILSISGLHVGILAAALAGILRLTPLPRSWSLALVALLVGFYMLLVRAETPVVRATLIVWLACLASLCGRRALSLNSLALAAIVVFVLTPTELFRIGTQLSFLSTGVLVAVVAALGDRRPTADPIERLIERSRSRGQRLVRTAGRGLRDAIVAGAAVWAATAPIAAATFHLFTPVAVLLNVVIAPLVAVAMALGFLCLAASVVSGSIGGFFGALCDLTLWAVQACVDAAAAVPGGHAWIAGPPDWWVMGWYAVLAVVAIALPQRLLRRPAPWLAVGTAWIGVGLAALGVSATRPWGRDFSVVTTSLGHGLGVLVRTPAGSSLLYDAGRLGAPGAATRGVSGVLWSDGLDRIDCLVLSHADTDHFNAVPELLERFAVGRVVVSGDFLRDTSPATADTVAAIRGCGIPIDVVASGDAFSLDTGCLVRVLHPGRGEPFRSDNEASLVLSVEVGGRRLLLTGDIEGEAVSRLVATNPGRCDVLVAPHHGTVTSLPPAIAEATMPRVVLVSGLGGTRWSDVRTAYARAAGNPPSRVIKTGARGAIRVRLSDDRIGIDRYATDGWHRER